MTYGQLSRVKELLGILDAAQDTELTNHLIGADAEIDSTLARENLAVGSPVPTMISEASAYIASAKFRRERVMPNMLSAYYDEGERLLMKYIREKIAGGGVKGVSRENLS